MNKNILITGASQRIGKELSLYFAKMGWNIAVHFNKSKKQAIILKKEIEKYSVKKVIVTYPSEYRILQEIKSWKNIINIPIEIREDNRFLCTPNEFSKWAGEKKQLRMELKIMKFGYIRKTIITHICIP